MWRNRTRYSHNLLIYEGVNKGLYVLLSRTQAGPSRTVKQEQEEFSRNHIQTFIYLSVVSTFYLPIDCRSFIRMQRCVGAVPLCPQLLSQGDKNAGKKIKIHSICRSCPCGFITITTAQAQPMRHSYFLKSFKRISKSLFPPNTDFLIRDSHAPIAPP